MRIDLNGEWYLNSPKYSNLQATIPGSVLSTLLAHHLIDDPYDRDNEAKVRQCLYDDYTLIRKFPLTQEQLTKHNYLFLDGVDTIAKIYINRVLVAELDDMLTRKRILLNNSILQPENEIQVEFTSPYRYIADYDDKGLFASYAVSEPKSPCIRKANYMFGWDWGPNLADMGIYRDIYILSTDLGYLEDFRHTCIFLPDGKVRVDVEANVKKHTEGTICAMLSLKEDGTDLRLENTLSEHNTFSFTLDHPKLWYPIGFGDPVLYELDFEIAGICGESQRCHYRIGIREVVIDNSPDQYGTNFGVRINGIDVFLKGACYIPEDNILSRMNPERTVRLLKLVKDFNHNVVRVWGGGFYPADDFYDYCDKNGVLVWQDLMFACSAYNIWDDHFRNLIIEETTDAVKRFRHHASVFLIAGDNECEDGVNGHAKELMESYRVMSLDVIVPLMRELTDTYFLRTSPRSVEIFQHQNDTDHYDTHYWAVWCGEKDLEEYQKVCPRMLSEVGHQSFPLMDTICRFTEEKDRELLSPVMLHHQKQPGSNTRILNYVKKRYGTPVRFEDLVYLSHLVQGEAIKICVEHLRRNRYRCNGAIYWQLNDCWPVTSWSSIDYYFGIKALHYFSKKFFAPYLISAEEKEGQLSVNVSNDMAQDLDCRIIYQYLTCDGRILARKEISEAVKKTASEDVLVMQTPFDGKQNDTLVYVRLESCDGTLLSENFYQHTKDKDICYHKPHFSLKKISNDSFEITADTFVKNVYIQCENSDVVLSDNYFHLLKAQPRIITANMPVDLETIRITSVNQVEYQ